MTQHSDYIIGEIKHLLSYGMTTEYIANVLKLKPGSIAKLTARHNEPTISKLFNQLHQKRNKKQWH